MHMASVLLTLFTPSKSQWRSDHSPSPQSINLISPSPGSTLPNKNCQFSSCLSSYDPRSFYFFFSQDQYLKLPRSSFSIWAYISFQTPCADFSDSTPLTPSTHFFFFFFTLWCLDIYDKGRSYRTTMEVSRHFKTGMAWLAKVSETLTNRSVTNTSPESSHCFADSLWELLLNFRTQYWDLQLIFWSDSSVICIQLISSSGIISSLIPSPFR